MFAPNDLPSVRERLRRAVASSIRTYPDLPLRDGYVFVLAMYADHELWVWLNAADQDEEVPVAYAPSLDAMDDTLPGATGRFYVPAGWLDE